MATFAEDEIAALDVLAAAGDYKNLGELRDSYARLTAQTLLAGTARDARQWAKLADAAQQRLAGVFEALPKAGRS